MPTNPNTPAILEALEATAQALQLNGSSAYKTVSIGAVKDVSDLMPLLEVTGVDDLTERVSMDQVGESVLVQDDQAFILMSIVDYTNAQAAELQIAQLRDLLTPALHSSVHLNSTPGVQGVYVENNGKYGYVLRNGVWYRMHQIRVMIRYYYEITLVN